MGHTQWGGQTEEKINKGDQAISWWGARNTADQDVPSVPRKELLGFFFVLLFGNIVQPIGS